MAAKEAADHAAEIAQVATNHFIHQVGFGPLDCSAHFEIDRRVPSRIVERLKIISNRREELTTNFFVERQLRVEVQFACEADRTGGR